MRTTVLPLHYKWFIIRMKSEEIFRYGCATAAFATHLSLQWLLSPTLIKTVPHVLTNQHARWSIVSCPCDPFWWCRCWARTWLFFQQWWRGCIQHCLVGLCYNIKFKLHWSKLIMNFLLLLINAAIVAGFNSNQLHRTISRSNALKLALDSPVPTGHEFNNFGSQPVLSKWALENRLDRVTYRFH